MVETMRREVEREMQIERPETTVPVPRCLLGGGWQWNECVDMDILRTATLELVRMHTHDLESARMHTCHYKAHIMFRTLRRLIYPINPCVRTPDPTPRPCSRPLRSAPKQHG